MFPLVCIRLALPKGGGYGPISCLPIDIKEQRQKLLTTNLQSRKMKLTLSIKYSILIG